MPPSPASTCSDLLAGELAAAVGVEADRPELAPLIPDAEEAGYGALAERGHYPINHLVVVRDELLAAHPDLGADLFEAFAEAKRRYVSQLRRLPEPTEGRPDAPAGPGDHRRRPAAVRARAQPGRARGAGPGTRSTSTSSTARPDLDSLFAPGTRELVG